MWNHVGVPMDIYMVVYISDNIIGRAVPCQDRCTAERELTAAVMQYGIPVGEHGQDLDDLDNYRRPILGTDGRYYVLDECDYIVIVCEQVKPCGTT